PSWMSALGSLFALGFAALGLMAGHRMYRIESERDRIDTEARNAREFSARRAQAALVSAWWNDSADGKHGAVVHNASETPVYQLFLTVLDSDDHSDGAKVHSLVLPPAGRALFWPVQDAGTGQDASTRRVKLSFTDAAGIRWQRNQYGSLAEL